MKTLVIYAHPDTKGNCSEILEKTKQKLQEKNINYELIDLYALHYDPVLHEDEHYTSGNRHISKQNKEFQIKIQKADKLILIYPIWWGGMPAILKGFFDRVFTPGFAFKYENNKPQKLLTGKKAIIINSTGGPRWAYALTLNMPQLITKHNILGFCGIKSRFFTLYNSRKSIQKISKIENLVNKALKDL